VIRRQENEFSHFLPCGTEFKNVMELLIASLNASIAYKAVNLTCSYFTSNRAV